MISDHVHKCQVPIFPGGESFAPLLYAQHGVPQVKLSSSGKAQYPLSSDFKLPNLFRMNKLDLRYNHFRRIFFIFANQGSQNRPHGGQHSRVIFQNLQMLMKIAISEAKFSDIPWCFKVLLEFLEVSRIIPESPGRDLMDLFL